MRRMGYWWVMNARKQARMLAIYHNFSEMMIKIESQTTNELYK